MIGPLVIVQCIWYVVHNWKDSTFLQLYGSLNGIYSRLKRSNNTVICCVQIISNNIHTPFEIELWDSGWPFDVRCLHSNEKSSLIASYNLRIFFIRIAWPSTNYIKENAILSKFSAGFDFTGCFQKLSISVDFRPWLCEGMPVGLLTTDILILKSSHMYRHQFEIFIWLCYWRVQK